MGRSYTHKTDYIAEAISLLLSQYRSSPNFLAILTALVEPLQDLEDDIAALLAQRVVTAAEGAQLDVLGKLVGQERAGRNDVDYQEWVLARVQANASQGTPSEIIIMVGEIVDIPVVYTRFNSASYGLAWTITGPAPDSVQTSSMLGIVCDASPSGVRYELTQTYTLPGPAFQFDTSGAGLAHGVFQTSRIDVP
jgi:hypothetical protein